MALVNQHTQLLLKVESLLQENSSLKDQRTSKPKFKLESSLKP